MIIQTEALPYTAIPGISYEERGKVRPQEFMIAGIKVTFKLGDLKNENDVTAVIVPHMPDRASERSVMGHFERSNYDVDTREFKQLVKEQDAPFDYGSLFTTPISPKDETTDFGKPQHFFNAITVTRENEPHLQFNAIRQSVTKAGWAAYSLGDDENKVNKITLPALGTGPAGHMKGYQSARAIFAGIHDFGTHFKADKKQQIHFSVVIKDDPMHAPIIDEFLEVMNDLSYLKVPEEGEVGLKIINQEKYLDHIILENALMTSYKLLKEYNADYPKYDS